jgi:hypothetical protein
LTVAGNPRAYSQPNAFARFSAVKKGTSTSKKDHREDAKKCAANAAQNEKQESGDNQPSYEDIETLAYLMFLNEGGVHGNHLSHWLEAEKLLKGP